QPPPGTVRDEEADRVLECRFDALLRCGDLDDRVREETRDESGAVSTQMYVAYRREELVAYHERATVSGPGLPHAMEVMLVDLSRKYRSGLLPLAEVFDHCRRMLDHIGKDWPLFVPEALAREGGTDDHLALVSGILAEEIARRRDAPPQVQATFAFQVGQALLALGECGLGEAALERAEDQVARIPPTDPWHARLSAAIADQRASWTSQLGNEETAYRARSTLSTD